VQAPLNLKKVTQVARKLSTTAKIALSRETSKLCKSCAAQDRNFLMRLVTCYNNTTHLYHNLLVLCWYQIIPLERHTCAYNWL